MADLIELPGSGHYNIWIDTQHVTAIRARNATITEVFVVGRAEPFEVKSDPVHVQSLLRTPMPKR